MSEPWGPQQHQPYQQQQFGPPRQPRPVLAIAAVVLIALIAGGIVTAVLLAGGDDDSGTASSSTTSSSPTPWTARTETPTATATAPATKAAFTDLSQEDRIYVTVITKHYPALAGEPAGVAEDGHNICTWLDADEAPDSIEFSLTHKYGATAARDLVTNAVVQFCPEHQIKLLQP